jgi:O-antigen ligase
MKYVSLSRQDLAPTVLCLAVSFAFCSIAVSQILLGLALLLFLTLGQRPRWPVGMPWAAAFLGLTIVAALASDAPRSALPQIKKLYLWTLLPLGASLLLGAGRRWLVVAPSLLLLAGSALWSLVEFAQKWQAAKVAGKDFYLAYVADRTTGFMSHWMTFGGHMLIGFCLAGVLLLFTRRTMTERWGLGGLIALFGVAMLLGQTRSIWLGAFCAAVFLVALWRPWALAALPVLAVGVYFVSPGPIRARVDSVFAPHGQVDSNEHRVITREVGVAMIEAHPWLGLGPEGPGKHFRDFLSAERRGKPLPDGFYGHLHNVYLQYAAERGLPALACLLVFVGLNFREWWRARRPRHVFAMATIVGLAATGVFEHNLGDSEVLTPFLALFGLAAAEDGEA